MADDKVIKCHGCGAPTTGAKYCERCQTELDNITAYVNAWKQINDTAGNHTIQRDNIQNTDIG